MPKCRCFGTQSSPRITPQSGPSRRAASSFWVGRRVTARRVTGGRHPPQMVRPPRTQRGGVTREEASPRFPPVLTIGALGADARRAKRRLELPSQRDPSYDTRPGVTITPSRCVQLAARAIGPRPDREGVRLSGSARRREKGRLSALLGRPGVRRLISRRFQAIPRSRSPRKTARASDAGRGIGPRPVSTHEFQR